MSALFYLLLPSGSLVFIAFNHPWKFQVAYIFCPALALLVLSMFLMEQVTGQFRLVILVAPCWMETPWLPHCSQHVGRCSSLASHHKWSHWGGFCRLGTKEFAITAFNHFTSQRYVFHRQAESFSPSVIRQQCHGQLQHAQQRFISNVGKNGKVGVLKRVYQTMPFFLN